MDILKGFSFELPTRMEYGVGVVNKLPEELEKSGAKRVLFVTDKGIEKAGLLDKVLATIEDTDFIYAVFDDVEPNPKDYNVHAGAAKAIEHHADTLVAVGGGSPIDCAKAISIVVTHGGKVRDYQGYDKVTKDVLPLIAVPTTAGSGSEVTFSSVITDSKENYKFGIKNAKIAARVALLDPEMTVTMPALVTASTGMDALTHAIEGYTARAAEPLADAIALYGIELIARNIRTAVSDPVNLAARGAMLLGNIMGGIAFSHSDVAAVHCMAEALGGKYDAAHGECNAIILPEMMQFNMDYCIEKYARVASAMGLTFETIDEGAKKAVVEVQKIARDVNLPSFKSLGVKEEDLEELAYYSAINISNEDNPRPMGKADYLDVFRVLMSKA